jgi:hypothetical protein
MDFARSKLICQHKISVTHTELNPVARTAVLDVLLNLDFEPRRQARHRETELVASHMRTVFSVPKHREYFCSGYPSEPILAEAAARQMDQFQMVSSVEPNIMLQILLENLAVGYWIQEGRSSSVSLFRRLIGAQWERITPMITHASSAKAAS